MLIMTFGEFKTLAETDIRLISPSDLSTHPDAELGVILSQMWRPIKFSQPAKDVCAELLTKDELP